LAAAHHSLDPPVHVLEMGPRNSGRVVAQGVSASLRGKCQFLTGEGRGEDVKMWMPEQSLPLP
jgi:hypothetical protein